MEYGIGIALALIVSCFARATGLDRDRAFYPTMAIVIASYYVLFAVMGGSSHALVVDSIVMAAFVLVAVLGFRFNLWLVVRAWPLTACSTRFTALVVANPGVPEWWPAFCGTFDVGAAGFLAYLLLRSKLAARKRATRPNHRNLVAGSRLPAFGRRRLTRQALGLFEHVGNRGRFAALPELREVARERPRAARDQGVGSPPLLGRRNRVPAARAHLPRPARRLRRSRALRSEGSSRTFGRARSCFAAPRPRRNAGKRPPRLDRLGSGSCTCSSSSRSRAGAPPPRRPRSTRARGTSNRRRPRDRARAARWCPASRRSFRLRTPRAATQRALLCRHRARGDERRRESRLRCSARRASATDPPIAGPGKAPRRRPRRRSARPSTRSRDSGGPSRTHS